MNIYFYKENVKINSEAENWSACGLGKIHSIDPFLPILMKLFTTIDFVISNNILKYYKPTTSG